MIVRFRERIQDPDQRQWFDSIVSSIEHLPPTKALTVLVQLLELSSVTGDDQLKTLMLYISIVIDSSNGLNVVLDMIDQLTPVLPFTQTEQLRTFIDDFITLLIPFVFSPPSYVTNKNSLKQKLQEILKDKKHQATEAKEKTFAHFRHDISKEIEIERLRQTQIKCQEEHRLLNDQNEKLDRLILYRDLHTRRNFRPVRPIDKIKL